MIASPKFGLDFVGDIPWGTHLCLFYETKDDLEDILVPYFAEGLRSNEACVWVTSEPFPLDEARALAKVVGNLDPFIKSGQLFLLPFADWHMKEGTFDADRVLQGLIDKEVEALERGFEGLRLAGNTFWIERSLWDAFTEYEETVNKVFIQRRIIALCPYSLEKCTGSDVADVIRNHVGTIIKKEGAWSVVEDVLRRKEVEIALQQRTRYLNIVNRVVKAGNEAANLSSTLSSMLETAVELLAFDGGFIALLNEDEGVAEIYYAFGCSDSFVEKRRRVQITNKNLIGIYQGEPLILEDFAAHALAGFEPEDLRVAAAVPLIAHDKVIGHYAVLSTRPHQFTDEERSLLVTLGREAGTVIARMQAEERVRAASLYSRNLIEASLDPLVTISLDGKITDVNNATEDVTGFSRDELIGSDFSDYFTEPEKARSGYKQVFTDGLVKDYPLAIRHKFGMVTDVLYNATVYRDENSEVQGVFAVARDVTDRKRAQEKLQSYSEHLEELVKERTARLEDLAKFPAENPNAVLRLALDGTVLYANSRAETLLMNERFPLEDVRTLCTQAYGSGTPRATEMTDGERVLQATLAPVEGKNYVNIYTMDITEQKRAETALRDAQRLAGIGETAAMIGHDLRNPLQGLRYIVDLQRMRFDRTPPEERDVTDWNKAVESFNRIAEQVFYMDKIVGDLQDYARPLQPQPERMSLNNLVEDVLEQVPRDGKVWVATFAKGIFIEADRHLMHRAFANIVLNAVQAMPEGGTLTITGSTSDHAVVITFRDTGVGIPAEIKEKLFSPLITGKAKGTGLGLAVVKRIVDAHGGTITFDSEEGSGTTFTVTLPQSRSG